MASVNEPLRFGVEAFLQAPPHEVDARSGYRVWYASPHAVIGEIALDKTALDDTAADFICDVLWPAMQRKGGSRSRYTFAHDWSRSRTYTKYARSRMVQFMMDHHAETANCGIVLSPTNAFSRIGAMTAVAAFRLVGFDVRVAESLTELIGAWDLQLDLPPERGLL